MHPRPSSCQCVNIIVAQLLLLLFPPGARGDENYLTRVEIVDGQLFPGNVTTFAGETVYIRVKHAVTDQQWCRFRRPGGPDVIVTDEGENRVTGWPGQACGIQVWNVTTADSGHWRLTSSRIGNLTRGFSFVTVKDISMNDTSSGRTLRSLDEPFTPPGSRYCYVLRPDQYADTYPQHENCTIPRAATGPGLDDDEGMLSNGQWNVVVGLVGQTEELQFAVNLQADVENLQSSVVVNNESDTIRLTCNLVHSTKTLSFCRFQRLSDGRGFNVQPGQGNIRYSYWGAGFAAGECGLTIVEPSDLDHSTWKCFVGYDKQGTMGAILDASDVPKQLEDVIGDDVYGLNGTAVNILCKASVSIDYCWFSHPMGHSISLSDRNTADITMDPQYFGVGLQMGECGVTLPEAVLNDSGVWRCHLGLYRTVGFEVEQRVTVRISDSNLVSTATIIDVLEIEPLYVDCTTIPLRLPIEYCRFVMPNGRGFSINENITQDNALDGIYFHPERHMNDGHCSIIVQNIREMHAGNWTCAARLVGKSAESSDIFVVRISGSGISVVAIVTICIGCLIAVAVLVFLGIRIYRKRRRAGETRTMPPPQSTTPDESVSLEHESPL